MKMIGRTRRAASRSVVRAVAETLESRRLFAANNWIGPASGLWSNPANWSDGVPTADDDVRVSGSTTITVDGPGRVADTISLSNSDVLNITGSLAIGNGGTTSGATLNVSGTLAVGGLLNMNGGSLIDVMNNGVAVQNAGEIRTNSSTLTVRVGGTYQMAGGSSITTTGNAQGFNNSGVLIKTPTGNATVAVSYNSTPTAEVRGNNGTITFSNGGTSTGGTFTTIDAAAVINLTGGSTHTWTGPYGGSGPGITKLDSGQINIGSAGATLAFAGGAFEWSGGTFNLVGAALTNMGTVEVVGAGTKNLNGSGSLVNNAVFNQHAGELRTNNVTITNAVTGNYHLDGTSTITTTGNAHGFSNAGRLNKLVGNANETAVVDVAYNSVPGAEIVLGVGNLTLSRGGTSTGGNFVLQAGSTVNITGGSNPTWSGTYTSVGAGIVSLSQGTLSIGNGGASFNFPVGAFVFSGGTINGNNGLTNVATGNITINGGVANLNGGATLVNQGNVFHTGGELRTNNATITNNGLYDLQGGSTITTTGNAAGFNNFATLTKSVGAAVAEVQVPYNSDAASTTRTDVGTLLLSRGGTSTGANFVVNGSAIVNVTGGSNPTWTGNYTASGTGTVQLSSGTINIGGGGATFNFPQGRFLWSAGQIAGGNVLTNASTGFMTLAGGVLDFTGGGAIVNNGKILHTGGELRTNNTTITNTATGTYEMSVGTSITTTGNAAGLTNFGLVKKLADGGQATITVPYNMRPGSATEAGTGQLRLQNSGSSTGGNFTATAGATIEIAGGQNPTWVGTYTGSGAGVVQLSAGSLAIGATGATFDFPGSLFQFVGGTILGGNALTNANRLTLAGSVMNFTSGTTLVNNGTIVHASGDFRTNNATITNSVGAVWDFQNAADASISTTGNANGFNNSGTLLKSAGAGLVNINVVFNNAANGLVTISNPNSTVTMGGGGTNAGGTYTVTTGSTLNLTGGSTAVFGGIFTGSGAGQVLLSGGTLRIPATAMLNFPAGLFQWTGGSIDGGGILINANVLNLVGGVLNLTAGTSIRNDAMIEHTAGELRTNNAIINNSATGTYRLYGGASITTTGNARGFNNLGLLLKPSGAPNAVVDVDYNSGSDAVAQSDAGMLVLSRGGSSTGGVFNATAATAVIDLTGGSSPTFVGTYTGSGLGKVSLASGTLNIGGGGATFNFPAGLFEWSGGTIAGGNTLTNVNVMTLKTGPMNLFGGTTLINAATVLHVSGTLQTNNTTITNSGTYDLQGGAVITTTGNAQGFTNTGTLLKSTGATPANLNVAYNSTPGAITMVDAGTLMLSRGGTNTGGTYLVALGATINLTAGSSSSFEGIFEGSGAGNVVVDSGQLISTGAGATFDFDDGVFQWLGGTFSGGSPITNAGFMMFSSGVLSLVGGTTIINSGTIRHTSGEVRTNNALITNTFTGTYDLYGGASITTTGNARGFRNLGTLTSSVEGTPAIIAVSYDSIGTTQVEAGMLQFTSSIAQITGNTLTGGIWNVLNGATLITPGTITTNGAAILISEAGSTWPQISGLTDNVGALVLRNGATLPLTTLNNSGFVTVGTPLEISGAFTHTGTVQEEIYPAPGGSVSGQIRASTVSLNGNLSIFYRLGFLPNRGDMFTLIENMGSQPISGTFTNLPEGSLLSVDGTTIRISYVGGDGNDVTLESVAPFLGVQVTDPNPIPHPATTDVAIEFVISNSGNLDFTAGSGQVYLSLTGTFNAATDILLGTISIPTVAIGSSVTITPTLTIPGAAGVGTYFVTLAANNQTLTTPAAILNVAPPPAPILGAQVTDANPGLHVSGSTVSLQFVVMNSGNAGFAAATGQVFLSTSGTFDPLTATLLGTVDLPAIGIGSSATVTPTFTLPNSLVTASYFVTLVANGQALTTPAAILPVEAGVPNVAVVTTDPAPAPRRAGDTFTLAFALSNNGTGPQQAGTATAYLSLGPSFNPATDIVLGQVSLPQLSAGTNQSLSASFVLPAGVPVGQYFISIVSSGGQALTSPSALVAVAQTVISVQVGNLDPTFGASGISTVTIQGNPFRTVDSVTQPDGKLIVAGTSLTSGFVLLRFNANGTLDTTFGSGGVVMMSLGSADEATSVTLQGDGKILLAGASNGDFAILRFNANGSLDGSFGNGGVTVIDLAGPLGATAGSADRAKSVAMRSDGKIYVAGSTSGTGGGDAVLVRLTASGGLDGSFNTSGVLAVDFAGGADSANTVSLQGDGAAVIAGSATVNGGILVAAARVLEGGTLDAKFGTGGKVTFVARGPDSEIFASAIQPDGKIVLAGLYTQGEVGNITSSDFYIARLLSNGKLDPKFGEKGQAFTNLPGSQFSAINDLVITPDGKIVVAGKTANSAADANVPNRLGVAVARYTDRGVLDTTFNGTGFLLLFQPTVSTAATLRFSSLEVAALDAASDFSNFADASVGIVDLTPGGQVRILASSSGDSSTDVSVAAIVGDGVDLTPTSLALVKVPASVVGGAKGQATVVISNSGTLAIKGSVPITLSLSPDSAAGANDIEFFTANVSLSLLPGRSKKLTLKFNFPTNLPDGTYFVVFSIGSASGVAEINTTNNSGLTATTTTVAAPFVDLAASFSPLPSAFAAGKRATVTLLLTNSGNVSATGQLLTDFYASADGQLDLSSDANLGRLSSNLKLVPSKALKLKFSFTPAETITGDFFLAAVANFTGIPAEKNPADNTTFSSAPVTFGV